VYTKRSMKVRKNKTPRIAMRRCSNLTDSPACCSALCSITPAVRNANRMKKSTVISADRPITAIVCLPSSFDSMSFKPCAT
jgi:hypothetical protein